MLHKYEGRLEAYYETGMEGMHMMMLHDDRGLRPGPDWQDPSKTIMYIPLGLAFMKEPLEARLSWSGWSLSTLEKKIKAKK